MVNVMVSRLDCPVGCHSDITIICLLLLGVAFNPLSHGRTGAIASGFPYTIHGSTLVCRNIHHPQLQIVPKKLSSHSFMPSFCWASVLRLCWPWARVFSTTSHKVMAIFGEPYIISAKLRGVAVKKSWKVSWSGSDFGKGPYAFFRVFWLTQMSQKTHIQQKSQESQRWYVRSSKH